MTFTLQDRTEEYSGRRTSPPLESGDRVTQREFHEIYERMSEIKKAELVEGVVFVSSPASVAHGDRVARITACLVTFASGLKGLHAGNGSSIIVDDQNEFQPDVFLAVDPSAGGQMRPQGEFWRGVPELVVEVAYTSRSYDLHQKLAVYERYGVGEYIVWDVATDDFHIFRRVDGLFVQLPTEAVFKSALFPGLWLNIQALVRGEVAAALKSVEAGRKSADYKKFAASLRKHRAGAKK